MSAPAESRAAFYKQLLSSARQQLSTAPSRDPFALMSNIAALLYHSFRGSYGTQSVNWSGFYLSRRVDESSTGGGEHGLPEEVLLLGPFHGLPAVSLIQYGKGVCGSAVTARDTQVVPDVHAHPNHIACDSASQSEIVVPLFSDASRTRLVGVLDIDSPSLGFFTEDEDRVALETLGALLGSAADWTILDAPIRVELPADDSCPMNRPIKGAH